MALPTTEATPKTSSVASKLCHIMAKIEAMPKDKRLTGGAGYRYLSEEAVTGTLHPLCAEAGLAIVPIGYEILDTRIDTTANGKSSFNARVRATFLLLDTDSDDRLEIVTLGEGNDSGDKVLNKCMTGAFKYALRQALMIATGDDPDAEPSSETVVAAARSRPQTVPADAEHGVLITRIKQVYEAAKMTSDQLSDLVIAAGGTPNSKITEATNDQLKAIIKLMLPDESTLPVEPQKPAATSTQPARKVSSGASRSTMTAKPSATAPLAQGGSR